MPYYKCVTCTTRLAAACGPPGRCEGCGSVLEPAGGLPELVGYRLVAPRRDESFEPAVAMPVQGLETAGPTQHPEGDTR